MQLLDVNILVHAHREDASLHAEVNGWINQVFARFGGIAVSELVLSGVLRVITHPKVFKIPTPLDTALEFIDDFRRRPNVHILNPGARHWQIFIGLCRDHEAKGNLVPDAYHAALSLEHGCQWVSLDRGFARFPVLDWVHPLDEL
jgi:toxin-antitoxin system PIN domain toxin